MAYGLGTEDIELEIPPNCALLITEGGKNRQVLTTKLNEEYNKTTPQKGDRIFYPSLNYGFEYDGKTWVNYNEK